MLCSGKVVLVTGAASGIGRSSALIFAREGAKVVVSDIAVEEGNETVKLIREGGGEAIFIRADVSSSNEVQMLIENVLKTYKRLDYAHNNAGIGGDFTGICNESEEIWDKVISINLKGMWLCMKYEIPQMLKLGKGSIVNTSSIAGIVGNGNKPSYHASKHGVVGLTKVAALEFACTGIRVNAVCPGIVDTPMVQPSSEKEKIIQSELIAQNPMGRLGRPEEIAEAVVWLCSDAASFINGHIMCIDGGWVAK